MTAAAKSRMAPAVVGAVIGSSVTIASWILFDYQSCHPLRKMQGWKPSDAVVRLHNTVRPSFTYPTFSLDDLAQYDGNDQQSGVAVYFSSDGRVWDVTSSEAFQKSYGQWKGKDASFALAKMSMSLDDVNRSDWSALTPEELDSLRSWTKYFREKYMIRGRLQRFQDW